MNPALYALQPKPRTHSANHAATLLHGEADLSGGAGAAGQPQQLGRRAGRRLQAVQAE